MNTRRLYDDTLSNLHKCLIFASEVLTEKVKGRIICTQRERVNKLPRLLVVSFAKHGRTRPQSFPRKRESTLQTFGNALSTDWIPAFAGMTGVSKGIRCQMTLPAMFCAPQRRPTAWDELEFVIAPHVF